MKIRKVPAHWLDAPKTAGRRSAGSRLNPSSGRRPGRKWPKDRGRGNDHDRESHVHKSEDRGDSVTLARAISA